MQILQAIFAGILAFDVLDRLTGDWYVAHIQSKDIYVSGAPLDETSMKSANIESFYL